MLWDNVFLTLRVLLMSVQLKDIVVFEVFFLYLGRVNSNLVQKFNIS